MAFPLRTHKSMALCGAVLLVALSVATLAFTTTNASPGCSHAQGRLFNATEDGGPGSMIGTIKGDYWIDFGDPNNSGISSAPLSPVDSDVYFTWAPSHVDGADGTISFMEYGALDFLEQQGPNGAVLVLITGGTGQWQDASGHLALSGYFHTDEGTGVWSYQGEVCVP